MYSSTLRKMGRTVIDPTFQKRPLFFWLKRKNRVSEVGGRSINRPVQLVEPDTAKSFGRGATFDEVDPDYISQAVYYMKNVGDSLTRFWTDEQENTGQSAIINLVKKNIQITVKGLEKKVQAMLWATTPVGLDLSGLPYYIASSPSTGTIAGINRANYPLWRNQQKTSTGSYYTYLLDDMLDLKLDCEKYGSVDYVITDKGSYEAYNAVAREQKWITDKKMGDAEFANVGWSGTPITLDHDCTSGAMYMLDSSAVEWAVSPSADFKWTKWKEKPNGLDRTAQLVLRAQLIVDNPGTCGVLTTIAA